MEKEKISQQLSAQVDVKHPWLAMTSMLIGAFVGMLSETSLNIALPTLGKVFNVEPSSLQWLVTGYMLVIGIVLPFLSLISKWFTTRQIVIFALADFAIGALISGFANSFTVLLIGRLRYRNWFNSTFNVYCRYVNLPTTKTRCGNGG